MLRGVGGMRRGLRPIVALAAFVMSADLSFAADWLGPNQTLLLFGGVFRSGTFPGWTMIPFTGGVEHNYLVGGALDTDYFSYGGFHFGTEIGVAGRFGEGKSGSAELWGGPSVHYRGFIIGEVTISPGFVVGLSAVSNTIGEERIREAGNSGNATLLFYLGPELAFRFRSMPNVELVVRTHHRSGAERRLGYMAEGHNANIFGMRFHF